MLTRGFLLKHAGITLAAVGLLVVIPVFSHFSLFSAGTETDADSSASIVLPDTPSGDFYILVRDSFVKDDTMADWEAFLLADEDDVLPILYDNVHCMVADGDAFAQQLAERYRAILSPDQMTVTAENPTLFISKTESGHVEMAILSADMAAALGFTPEQMPDGLELLTVSGG